MITIDIDRRAVAAATASALCVVGFISILSSELSSSPATVTISQPACTAAQIPCQMHVAGFHLNQKMLVLSLEDRVIEVPASQVIAIVHDYDETSGHMTLDRVGAAFVIAGLLISIGALSLKPRRD